MFVVCGLAVAQENETLSHCIFSGRLVRLIPSNGASLERAAIRTFFNHRLSPDSDHARLEWLDIVEARHELWKNISSPKKELIRSFINVLNMEIVKRARPSSVFNFANASVGNMFLTGSAVLRVASDILF